MAFFNGQLGRQLAPARNHGNVHEPSRGDAVIEKFGKLAMLALLTLSTGCAMCQNPFDYCAPVKGDSGRPNCEFGARTGSAFAPPSDSTYTATLSPPTRPTAKPPAAEQPRDFYPAESTTEAEMPNVLTR